MPRPEHVYPAPVEPAPQPEVINHSPWPAQYFQHIDPHGEAFHVMVCRITYSLRGMRHDPDHPPTPHLLPPEAQSPLRDTDRYRGEAPYGAVLEESDFAPYKPKCDVLLVNAHAYAPDGRPSPRWAVNLRFGDVIDKSLQVAGPRRYQSQPGQPGQRRLGEPEAVTRVALDYALAYGGPDQTATRLALDQLAEDPQLTPAERARAERAQDALGDDDPANPIGLGRHPKPWLDAAQAVDDLTRPPLSDADRRLRRDAREQHARQAPQIEVLGKPYTGQIDYPAVGYGAIGRAWSPRFERAGTHDAQWKASQWPKSPLDHDYRYWNCAPDDQQIAYPEGGELIELIHLTPVAGPVRFRLPKQDLRLLTRLKAGPMLFVPMRIDSVILDFAAATLSVVRRATVSGLADVRKLELGTWPEDAVAHAPPPPVAIPEPHHGR